jgi:hypothetical protein
VGTNVANVRGSKNEQKGDYQMICRKLFLVAIIGVMLVGLNMVSPANAALSVGAEIGGNFIGTLGIEGSTNTRSVQLPGNTTVDPSLLTGLTAEYYFINKGVLKYNWPTWMKNFSVAIDVTHNQLAFGHQTANFICQDPNWGTLPLPEFNGYTLTIAFLLKYRFPLIKGTDFPDGRLFYYIGVGPGISYNYLEANNNIPDNGAEVGHGWSTNATFVAESGVSLFVVRDVSVDLFFRYRYFRPNYEFNIGIAGAPLYVRFDNNSYNAGLRIAFHF